MLLNPEILTQFQSFSLGPFTFYGYGIIIGISIASALFIFLETIPEQILKDTRLLYRILFTIGSGLIGGRLLYILGDISSITSLSEIVAVWEGGTTIFGVILGGFIGLFISFLLFKPRYPLLMFTDYAVPAVAIGQAIGRWGNFINQELYGTPTEVPWRMFISPRYRAPGYETFEYFHPVFLYESILMLTLGILLWLTLTRNSITRATPGLITGLYITSYGIIRLIMERFRIDGTAVISTITYADILAFALVIIGAILIVYARKEKH